MRLDDERLGHPGDIDLPGGARLRHLQQGNRHEFHVTGGQADRA